MPLFVLLDHDHPEPHFDLMLQRGPALATWRLPAVPEPGHDLRAERIGDHRLAYLEYEGPVSGGRGRVLRVDWGEYQVRSWDEGRVEVEVQGQLLRGSLELVCEAGEAPSFWRLTLRTE